MTTATVLRQTQLLNRLVLDLKTAEELGQVERLWIDPTLHQIVGVVCKSGLFGGKKYTFGWTQISAIGDSVIVDRDRELDPNQPLPQESLIGHEIWTDTGNKAGGVVDYLFNPQTGEILYYMYTSSGWAGVMGSKYILAPTEITSLGSKRLIAQNAAIQNSISHRDAIQQNLIQVKLLPDEQREQEEIAALEGDVQSFFDRGKAIADQVAKRAKETAEGVTEKAKEQYIQLRAELEAAEQTETPTHPPVIIDIDEDSVEVLPLTPPEVEIIETQTTPFPEKAE
ncbi:PRC-barrel domain-containing protein [Kamptonema cortianum]|uniref:PRC-barrel domain-containing protein n=1 Tax=Geitlerinema calcuttense NRMC-F 0142 TaxID=2922238 RepID=A0ABT7LVA5_9CYAN|nr:PRC-barrel domain-containing protein [Geitlerinema calcuttense]MDK3159723.1 PRC-barrel domain-containing protein [Kamptonema cortianum]MDL5055976.1 PRC-barrel domain-containing protein [Geitlerinema calcuttense NRMC-F 0142]